jgi:glycosyltransferase domain-containing protein
MAKDNSLTIILAVKDRLAFAHRWMRFMDQEQCPYRIIIADGSLDADSGRLLSRLSDFPSLAYEYIRFPADENYAVYYKKIGDALRLVDTPYALMADDDDFYSIEGIKTAIKFLDGNPDFVCARGSYVGFSVKTPIHERGTGVDTVYGEMDFRGVIYPPVTIASDSAVGRLNAYCLRWTPHWYNIHRTNILRACWDEVAALNIKNIFLMEHTLGSMMASNGKIFAGKYPYYYRQVEGAYVTASKEAQRKYGDPFDQMLSESWSSDYNAYVKTLGAYLAERDGITTECSLNVAHAAFRSFFGPTVASVFQVRRGVLDEKMRHVFKHVIKLLANAVIAYEKILRLNRQRSHINAFETSEFTGKVKSFLARKF